MEPVFPALALGILGVWRITHLLNAEDGPGQTLVALRKAAGSGFWGRLMDCFQCLSLWVSAPFALLLGRAWLMRGLLWLAFSAGAILLERVASREAAPPPITYYEDPPDGKQ
ncbi:MAG: hypothetical protein NT029_11675 [Armatimonadetes bacterium]|nr:hypothetical protein [Armatimonadota bacterium]